MFPIYFSYVFCIIYYCAIKRVREEEYGRNKTGLIYSFPTKSRLVNSAGRFDRWYVIHRGVYRAIYHKQVTRFYESLRFYYSKLGSYLKQLKRKWVAADWDVYNKLRGMSYIYTVLARRRCTCVSRLHVSFWAWDISWLDAYSICTSLYGLSFFLFLSYRIISQV